MELLAPRLYLVYVQGTLCIGIELVYFDLRPILFRRTLLLITHEQEFPLQPTLEALTNSDTRLSHFLRAVRFIASLSTARQDGHRICHLYEGRLRTRTAADTSSVLAFCQRLFCQATLVLRSLEFIILPAPFRGLCIPDSSHK